MRRQNATILTAALLGLAACGGATPRTQSDTTRGGSEDTASAALPPARTISGAEARALVADGAFLLDVTPPPRNERSEIEGRTNIPLPQLRGRLSEVPRDRPVVAYCLGGQGSPRAGALLQSEGYDVYVLGARDRWFEGLDAADTGDAPPAAEEPATAAE